MVGLSLREKWRSIERLDAPAIRKCNVNVHVREGLKKNWKKAVRLTAWVEPPLPRSGQEKVKNFDFGL